MKNVIARSPAPATPMSWQPNAAVSFGYNTLVSDMRALPVLRDIGCPVVFDATHSVQQPAARGPHQAASANMCRCGPRRHGHRRRRPVSSRPTRSRPCPFGRPNMVALKDFEPLMAELLEFDALAKRRAG